MPPSSEVSKPIITAISFSHATDTVTVGGSLQITLTVADDGGDERVYSSALTISDPTLYDLTRINSTTYSFDLPVPEGVEITYEDLIIPTVVFNSAGIPSDMSFEGVDFSGSVSIDTARPDIEQVTIAGTPKNVGDTLAVTLTVEDDKGDTYTNLVGTVSGFELSNLVRVDSTTYTAEFTVGEGGIDTSASGHIPVSLTIDDSAGNTSHQYSNPTLIESPTVLAVSSPDTAFKIGDMFTFFISVADDNGEIYTKATIGNPEGRQYDLVRINSTTYTLSLPIPERYEVNGKKTYFAAEEDLRLRITVFDAEGNMSNSFLTNISNDNDSIDLARPIIEQVSIADTAMQAGDTVTVTLTVEDDKGDAYTNLVGTIGGFELSNLVRVDSTTYTAEFTVRDFEDDFNPFGFSEDPGYLSADADIPVSLIIEDSAGNASDEFTTAISQSNDSLDGRVGPNILAVSEVNGSFKIGDILELTITVADDGGDVYSKGVANPLRLYDLTRINSTTYTMQIPIDEQFELDENVNIDSSMQIFIYDSSNNVSNFFSVPLSDGSSIDFVRPVIEQVSIADTAMQIGDTVAVTLTVQDDDGDNYTNLVGSVGGFDLSNLARVDSTTYTAEFTVGEGGTDVDAGEDIPVSLILDDSAGNTSNEFTTAISQASDAIDANGPVITAVSSPDTAFKIGDIFTFTINVADDNGETYTKGTIGNPEGKQYDLTRVDSTTYTLSLPIPERYEVSGKKTFFAAEDDLRIRITVFDAAGNKSNGFLTDISNDNDSIDLARPIIEQVSIADTAMQVGDTVAVTLTVEKDSGHIYTNLVGSIGGFDVSNLVRVDSTTYTAEFTVGEGGTDVAADADIPVSLIIEDPAGNASNEFITAISQQNDPVDSTSPVISSVSIPDLEMGVGDTVTVTLTVADDAGDIYTNLIGTVGDYDLSNLTRIDSTTYTAVFTVAEGDNNIVAGDDISVALTIDDSVGNTSDQFTTSISQANDPIDANGPVITGLSIPNVPMKIGDIVTLTITVEDDGGDIYPASGGLGPITRINSTTYTMPFEITEGTVDFAAGDDFPFSLEIIDSAGNASNWFEGLISQDNDPIDANRPTISAVSIPDVAMSVGDAVTVSITAGEAGLTLTSGTINGVAVTGFTDNGGGNYTAIYTVLEGHTDRAAGDEIPVSFLLADPAGNTSAVFTAPATQSSTKVVFDLINGTSSDIDSRAFSADETYDIYILVDSDSAALSQPDLWSDAANLGSDDTLHLVGDGSPIINASGNAIKDVTFSGTQVFWFSLGSSETIGSASFTPGASALSGVFVRAYGSNFTSSSVQLFTSNNLGYGFSLGDIYSTVPNVIDANSPVVTDVSFTNTFMNIGDTGTVTLTVEDDSGDIYTNLVGTVGGFELGNLTRIDNTTYTADFTVQEGGADILVGEDIPVSLTLDDSAGNTSSEFTTAVSLSNVPVIFDLLSGTSSDIDGRAFSIDKTYDIYILVGSGFAGLEQPDIWSGKTNLGSDDTIYLVGNGPGIISSNGNPVTDIDVNASLGAISWHGHTSGWIPGYTRTYFTTIPDPGAFLNPTGLFQRSANSSSDQVRLFTSTTLLASYEAGDIYSTPPNIIDANTPTIASVSIPDQAMDIDDVVSVTISASESGLSLVSGSVNGIAVTDFTDNGGGSYSAIYTVAEGHTDIAAGDDIPVSFVMSDDAGNQSAEFTSAISQTNDSINGSTITAPVITGLSIPNAPIKIGDVVTLTITVEDDGGDIYPTDVVGPITRINSTTYTSEFTIPDGSADFAAGEDIPFETQIFDSAGNASNVFKVLISQDNDPIDANAPVITNASMSGNATKVGDTVTVTITVEDDGGDIYTGLVGNVGGFALGDASRIDNTTYTADFTVQEGGADVALNSDILISLTLEDTAGNTSNEFAGPVIQKNTNTRVIFDLINGTSTDIDGRVITANKTYDIYILVDSNSKSVTLDSSETWSGKANLGADDTIYLVGNGSPILNRADDFIITTTGTSHFINWYSTPNNLHPGAHLTSAGQFQRSYNSFNSNVELFSTTNSWDGLQFGDIYSTLPNIIDANTPTITSVSIPDTAMTVDDVVTVTISASESGLRLVSGSVNGVLVTGFTDNGDGSYSANYTVAVGDTERAAGDDIPVSFVLEDSAGNSSTAFTAAISQGSDAIDINPDASNVRVVFDLIAGTSTDIDSRTFASDTAYDIYIQVDSNSKTLSQPEIWSGGSNLGSDDTIYLVGNGSDIINTSGQAVTQGNMSPLKINWMSGAYLWTSHFSRSYSYSYSEVNLFASTLSTLINIGPVFTTLPGTGPTFTSTSPSIFVSAG